MVCKIKIHIKNSQCRGYNYILYRKKGLALFQMNCINQCQKVEVKQLKMLPSIKTQFPYININFVRSVYYLYSLNIIQKNILYIFLWHYVIYPYIMFLFFWTQLIIMLYFGIFTLFILNISGNGQMYIIYFILHISFFLIFIINLC